MLEHLLKAEMVKERIGLISEAFETVLEDFIQYCNEMKFKKEVEFKQAAAEYVQCNLHYGLMR